MFSSPDSVLLSSLDLVDLPLEAVVLLPDATAPLVDLLLRVGSLALAEETHDPQVDRIAGFEASNLIKVGRTNTNRSESEAKNPNVYLLVRKVDIRAKLGIKGQT